MKKKLIDKIKIIVFITLLFTLSIITVFFTRKSGVVLFENRKISKYSSPSFETVLDGSYQKNLEKFFDDVFAFRTPGLKVKTWLDMEIAQKPKISDVVISEDGKYLLDYREYREFSDEDLDGNFQEIERLNDYLKDKDTGLVVVGIPRQSHMLADKYKTYLHDDKDYFIQARKYFSNKMAELNIDYLDMYKYFKEDPEAYYFQTDHHQNFKASLLIYEKLVELVNDKYFNMDSIIDELDIVENKYPFMGSHNTKLFNLFDHKDKLCFANPKEDIEFKRFDKGKEKNYINKPAKTYTSYMGGDKGLTEIYTDRKGLPNICIIGDSTTNSVESIMWMNADKFTSFDFRHYEGDLIEYLDENPQDLVIVMVIDGYFTKLDEIMK